MITVDILEKFEQKKGIIVGLADLPKPLYLGLVPLDTKQQNLPYGLSFLGTIDDNPTPLQRHVVNKKKVQKLKGNVPKLLKELELVKDNQSVQIISAEVANQQLKKYLVIQTRPDSFDKLFGYVFKGSTYLIGNQRKLLTDLLSEQSTYLQKTKQSSQNSKILLQPIALTVNMIGLNQANETNTITVTQKKYKSNPVVSLFRIQAKLDDSIIKFDKFIRQHVEKVTQLSKEPVQQLNIQFLSRLPYQNTHKMVNIHQYLPIELLWQHLRYFCKGRYHFYHYGDEQFNDKGWGCAYRALQTVLSWFNQQQYTSIDIPSIRQIQKILFEVDRSRNLINTNDWIGANEVGWLITRLCKVECKIVYLPDGANFLEKVQILKHHLETVGTPIMYGGDMYAYTIVGLNYSWETGQCLALIVDPHYTQENTPKQVVSKDGVYWRQSSKLFKKGVYYNFCLPQIPS